MRVKLCFWLSALIVLASSDFSGMTLNLTVIFETARNISYIHLFKMKFTKSREAVVGIVSVVGKRLYREICCFFYYGLTTLLRLAIVLTARFIY